MTNSSVFTIYNAAAGSGKTFTLVKNYLTILLQSDDLNKFTHLLAITFTNKAVAEMKARVINTLYAFSSYTSEMQKDPMLSQLAEDLSMSPDQIARKSLRILRHILTNYAAFDILTIDTLTHRLLRTFAKDLALSNTFEVSLDTGDLLAQAVDALIDKTGSEPDITDTLVNFALQKTQEDKSWNIAYDLNAIAKLLVSENDRAQIAPLSKKTLSDFKALEKNIQQKIISLKAKIKEATLQLLTELQARGIEQSHFSGGYFYKHILKLLKTPDKVSFIAKWQQEFESKSLYIKTLDDDIKRQIDELRPQLDSFFIQTRGWVYDLNLHQALLKKISPLSVLHLIQQELSHIKESQNVVLISEFNHHIYTYLKQQPAAFIYERLGERYSNYFIDEFQDTSVLQWQNLIPLIDNALSSSSRDNVSNSLLVVGDAKQAIYRWRGGQAEQFIHLTKEKTPFQAPETQTRSLDTNYRSLDNIIDFNNQFFKHISQYIDNPFYKNIYEQQSYQKKNDAPGGLVSLSFVEGSTKDDLDVSYPEEVYQIVLGLIEKGYLEQDICVLTRTNKQGSVIAEYLTGKNLAVTSPDSLLIKNAPSITFLVSLMGLIAQPNTAAFTIKILEFLVPHLKISNPNTFYLEWVNQPTSALLEHLRNYDISFSISQFEQYPLYEGVNYIIKAFGLDQEADAYIISFLNCIHLFAIRRDTGLFGFLTYWEHKKDTVHIETLAQAGAIQVMSIHKSKGLEFPVVILPYADTTLYSFRGEHHWFPLDSDSYNGFRSLMIDHKNDLAYYGESGNALHTELQQQQQFDAINLLYVAFTRSVERLYVLGQMPSERQMQGAPTAFNTLLVDFLKNEQLWGNEQHQYLLGNDQMASIKHKPELSTVSIPVTSTLRTDHNLNIALTSTHTWDETRKEAIVYGNLMHQLLSEITVKDDLVLVIDDALTRGVFTSDLKDKVQRDLQAVVYHPKLSQFFQEEHTVYNERSILVEHGETLIPDRVEIAKNGTAYIIDYKTGVPSDNHKQQIEKYVTALETMHYTVDQFYLVYILENGGIEIV